MTTRRFAVAILAGLMASIALTRAQTPAIPADQYSQLKFRYIGPVGNRIISIAGVPRNPSVYYAVAASDPNVVWAGTGESFIRSNISIGNGIYRSADAGKTWTHAGLDLTGRIGRIVIDPRDPSVVFACA